MHKSTFQKFTASCAWWSLIALVSKYSRRWRRQKWTAMDLTRVNPLSDLCMRMNCCAGWIQILSWLFSQVVGQEKMTPTSCSWSFLYFTELTPRSWSLLEKLVIPSQSRNSWIFMEFEGSSPRSKQSATYQCVTICVFKTRNWMHENCYYSVCCRPLRP
jgi:hypothetical protein